MYIYISYLINTYIFIYACNYALCINIYIYYCVYTHVYLFVCVWLLCPCKFPLIHVSILNGIDLLQLTIYLLHYFMRCHKISSTNCFQIIFKILMEEAP